MAFYSQHPMSNVSSDNVLDKWRKITKKMPSKTMILLLLLLLQQLLLLLLQPPRTAKMILTMAAAIVEMDLPMIVKTQLGVLGRSEMRTIKLPKKHSKRKS